MLQWYFTNIIILIVISNILCGVLFSFNIIILLMWLIALFKNSIRLRKKVKYSTLAVCNQETCLEALNSKVEYRKSLFLLAIVISELVSSLLIIVKIFENLTYYAFSYQEKRISANNSRLEISTHKITGSEFNNSICNMSQNSANDIWTKWGLYNDNIMTLVLSICFSISLILTFSLVSTLMSYYVMVTKKSLNYNTSLQSVDLAREQKFLLLVSSVMCLILLVLLVRVQVYIAFQIVESCFVIIQLYLTYKYSNTLIQVFKWKLKDTEIAFGTDNYQYKLYNRTLSNYKWFALFYKLIVSTFSLHIVLHALTYLASVLHPSRMYHLYGVCLNFSHYSSYIKILNYLVAITSTIEKVPLSISTFLLFSMNLFTIPFLLSRINMKCHFNLRYVFIRTDKSRRVPLLA